MFSDMIPEIFFVYLILIQNFILGILNAYTIANSCNNQFSFSYLPGYCS